MDPLMVLKMEIWRVYFFYVNWDLLMLNLGSADGKVLISDEGINLVSTNDEVLCTILGNTMSKCKY